MEKIIDGILMAVYVTLLAYGGHYTLRQTAIWAQRLAFEKIHQGLPSLEHAARIMTGKQANF